MKSPAATWRNQHQNRKYLNQIGTIQSITRLDSTGEYAGVIKIKDEKLTSSIISLFKTPQIGDQVKGILRIINHNDPSGIIEYGIKYKVI